MEAVEAIQADEQVGAKCRYCSTPGCHGECKAAERETVIQFDDAKPGMVHIYTAQSGMMRKMARHRRATLVETHHDESGRVTGVEYDIPRDCLVIRAGKRRVSELQREAIRQRAVAMGAKGRAARQARPASIMASKLQNMHVEPGATGVTSPEGIQTPSETVTPTRSPKRSGNSEPSVPKATRKRSRQAPPVPQVGDSVSSEPSATMAASAQNMHVELGSTGGSAPEGIQVPLDIAEEARG